MAPTLYLTLPFLGEVTVSTYGIALVLAYVAGIAVVVRKTIERGKDPWHVARGGALVIAAGFVGAKLPAIPARWQMMTLQYEMFRATGGGSLGRALEPVLGAVAVALGSALEVTASLLRSGGWFQAGLVAATIAAALYLRRQPDLRFDESMDTLALALPLGHAVGRVGCLAAGCCYGGPTEVPWAVVFTTVDSTRAFTAPLGVPLHPTQAYEALANVALFLVLLRLYDRTRIFGLVSAAYLIGYGVLRSAIETLRGDPRGEALGGALSLPQLMSLIMITAGLVVLWRVAIRLRSARVAESHAGGPDAPRRNAPAASPIARD